MPNDISLAKLVGIQIAGGLVAGAIAAASVMISWGTIQSRLERAVSDIEKLTDRMYTQREATLQLSPITGQLARQSQQLDDIARRLIRLESRSERAPFRGPSHDMPSTAPSGK